MQANNHTFQQLIIISSLIIFTLVIIVSTIMIFYNKKRILYKKDLDYVKTEHEKQLLKMKIEIQEEALQNISREIHDNIGLTLTLAKLNLNTLAENKEKSSNDKILTIIELISKSISDLRNISRGMNADMIYNNGLLNTLEDEIEKINKNTSIDFKFYIQGEAIFQETQKELLIFRIVQEGINNIIKHSGATQSTIKIGYTENNITLEIQDNGRGIKTIEEGFIKGSGLINMESRIKMLDGTMNITSNKSGTSILFTIPNNA